MRRDWWRNSWGARWTGLILLATLVQPAKAQDSTSTLPTSRLLSDQPAFYLAVNSAIGGLSAAVRAWVHHRPVREAFVTGLSGGAITYTGMRLVGASTPLRLPGLLLTGLGASVSRNAADGVQALSHITLPAPL